jgi:hypothetical protein
MYNTRKMLRTLLPVGMLLIGFTGIAAADTSMPGIPGYSNQNSFGSGANNMSYSTLVQLSTDSDGGQNMFEANTRGAKKSRQYLT